MPIFIANLVACLFIGVISAPTIERGVIGRGSKLFLATGVMGGLSTFSSFVWGTDQMLAIPAERFPAVLYLVFKYGPMVHACQNGIETGFSLDALAHGHGPSQLICETGHLIMRGLCLSLKP